MDDQLASMMMTWARESSTEEDATRPAPAVERPQIHDPDPAPPRITIPETAPVVRKGPRTAHHIRRNRPPSPNPIKDHELDRDGWRAAGHRADEVPSLDPMLSSPPRTFLLPVRFRSISSRSELKTALRFRPPVLRYRTCPRSPSPSWASLGLTSPTRHHQRPGIEAGNVQHDHNAAPGRVDSCRSARNHALAVRFETRL